MPSKATEFTVSISGIALTPKQRSDLNTAIQQAALQQIAAVGVRAPFAAHLPRGTMGIWIRPPQEIMKTVKTAPRARRTR